MNLQIARDKIIKFGKKDIKIRNKYIAKRKKDINCSFEQVAEFDKITTKFLNQVINKFGVPTIPTFGKRATVFGFLIAQHSPDLEFQKRYLNLLKKEDPKHIFKRHIAYLEDRINMFEDRPQKYGTQFVYDEKINKFVPYKLLDAENINKFRKEVDLDSFENYSKVMDKQY